MTKKLKKGEDHLLEIEINFLLEKGGVKKIEINKEVQKVIFSALSNFFGGRIPLTTHSQEQS